MSLKPIETQEHDVRLTLTVPNTGRIIIEGKLGLVSKLWDDVKTDFMNGISDVLKNQPFTKGDFVPVEMESNGE